MAEKNYKINEEIEVIYQAPNKESNLLAVTGAIFLPNGSQDSGHADFTLTERGNTGTYHGEFVPDEEGDWQVIISKDGLGEGQVTKRYSVGLHNVSSVGQDMAKDNTVAKEATLDDVETKIDSIVTSVASLDTPPMVS